MMFVSKAKYNLALQEEYARGYTNGQDHTIKAFREGARPDTHPRSFELCLEPYCDGCMRFEPAVERPEISILYSFDKPVEQNVSGPTIIRCLKWQHCAKICEYIKRSIENGNYDLV